MNYFFVFNAIICLTVSTAVLIREKPMTVTISVVSALLGAFFISLVELPDYHSYRLMFEITPSIQSVLLHDASFEHVYGEPGYTVFTTFFKLFSEEYFDFRFIAVLLALFLKVYFLCRVAKAPSIAIVAYFALFFYMDSFLLRQSFAAGFVAIALLCLIQRNNFVFVALVCLASTFHASAMIALPLALLVRFDINKIQALAMLLFIFVLGFAGAGKVIGILIERGWLPDYVSGKLFRYSIGDGGEATGLLRGAVLLYTSGVLCYILFKEQIQKNFEHYNTFLCIALYGLLFLVGFSDFGIFGDRVFRLFGVAYAVVFSSLVVSLAYSQRAFLVMPISFIFVIISMLLIPTGRVIWLE